MTVSKRLPEPHKLVGPDLLPSPRSEESRSLLRFSSMLSHQKVRSLIFIHHHHTYINCYSGDSRGGVAAAMVTEWNFFFDFGSKIHLRTKNLSKAGKGGKTNWACPPWKGQS
jgi:hypothetical protein